MLNESDYNEEKSTSQASSLIFLSPFPWVFPLVSLDGRYRERHVANLVSLSFMQTTTRIPNSFIPFTALTISAELVWILS